VGYSTLLCDHLSHLAQQRNSIMKQVMTFAAVATAFAMTFGPALAQTTTPKTTTPSTDQPGAATSPPARVPTATTPAQASGTIPEVAKTAGQFSTLLAAVNAAGLSATLSGEGPFTVFAPTDAAFAALPAGEVERLLMPENRAELTALLNYHVVPSRVLAAGLSGKTGNIQTANGASVAIDGRDGVKVGTATVIQADVLASNGVIHVIDKVLVPAKATTPAAAKR
jgi:uncharacterized surface protein with fasciclin (FAS1) repeats